MSIQISNTLGAVEMQELFSFLFSSLLLIFYSVLLHLVSVLGNKHLPCSPQLVCIRSHDSTGKWYSS